ncbi:MAG: FN3 associated domain-containing protein, partial [Verrucomicrobiales bacterium]
MLVLFRQRLSAHVTAVLLPLLCLDPNLWAAQGTGGYDGNRDGFGDIWQSHYDVPPFGLAAQDDDDFDGFSNLSEALAGTNPYLASSTLEVNVVQLASGELQVSWPAQPGKRYQLEMSTDMLDWYPWGEPIAATSTGLVRNVPSTGKSQVFFRVRVIESNDTDGDGLTDWEERAIGTNWQLADTDDDGVTDQDEWRLSTSPLLASDVPARLVVRGGDRQSLTAAKLADGTPIRQTRELLTVQLINADGNPWSGQEVVFNASPIPAPNVPSHAYGFHERLAVDGEWIDNSEFVDSRVVVTDAAGMASTAFRTNHLGVTLATAALQGGGAAEAEFTLYSDPPPVPKPEILTGLAPGDHYVADVPGVAVLKLTDAASSAVIRYTLDGSIPSLTSPVYDSSRPLVLDREATIHTAAEEDGRWSDVATLHVKVPRVRIRAGHNASICYLAGTRLSSPALAPLGPNATSDRSPIPLAGPSGYMDVALGSQHGVAIGLVDGGLYTWGAESFGEKGDGAATGNSQTIGSILVPAGPEYRFIKTGAGQYHGVALDAQGRLWGWGRAFQNGHSANKDVPTLISGLPRVIDVAAGLDFTAAIGIDGEAYFFGNLSRLVSDVSIHPSVGVVYTLRRDAVTNVPNARFVRISAGSSHLVVSDELAQQWFLGKNDFGQCGFDPTTTTRVDRLRLNVALAPTRTGALKACGDRTFFTLGSSIAFFGSNPGIAGWPAILYQPAVFSRYVWSDEARQRFGSVGGTTNCIVWSDSDGEVLAVGTDKRNAGGNAMSYGRIPLGRHAGVDAALLWDRVSVPGAVDQLAASTGDSFFVLRDGKLFGFGENSGGQLGIGSLQDSFSVPVEIRPPTGAGVFDRVAAGVAHTLATTPAAKVYSWGQNANYQLGTGTLAASLTPVEASSFNPAAWARTHKLIAVGDEFSVVTAGSAGRAAGLNTSGQCRQTPSARTQMNAFSFVAEEPDGDLVPSPATALAAGRAHIICVLDWPSGWLQAWGANGSYQVSRLPSTINSALPISTYEWMDEFLAPPGIVAARGTNFAFRGSRKYRPDSAAMPTLIEDGVWAWGEAKFAWPEITGNFSPLYGQSARFGDPSQLPGLEADSIVQLSAGGRHQLAVDLAGRVWAWGDNSWGQLGQSNLNQYTTVVQVPDLPPITHVAAGNRYSMAMDRTGRVFLWGNGTNRRMLMSSHLPSIAPPAGADDDADGLPDSWELASFGNLAQNSAGDWDGDGDTNGFEFSQGSKAQDVMSRASSRAAGMIGTTESGAKITSSGAATVSVPVKLPPGFAGPLPALSFEYNSQTDQGNCGWSWDLAGVSRITRGPTHPNRDAIQDPVDFDSNDLFFLDGQRLIPVSATAVYGAHGTEYRTESDVFSRVISLKTSNPNIMEGPDAFTVETKSGLVMRFEPPDYTNPWQSELGGLPTNFDPDGKTAHGVWLLKEVTDRSGNQTLYDYTAVRGVLDGSNLVVFDEATNSLEPGVMTSRSQRSTLRPADYLLTSVAFGLNRRNRNHTASFGFVRIRYRPVARPTVRFVNDRPVQNGHLVSYVTSGVTTGPFHDNWFKGSTTPNRTFRSYELHYTDSSITGRQLLTEIQETGTDGVGYQPLQFAYGQPVRLPRGRDIGTNIWPWVPTSSKLPVDVITQNGANNGTRLVDANGDGLVDLVRQDAAWLNDNAHPGLGWVTSPLFHAPIPLHKTNASAQEQKEFGAIQFLDMNGDRLPDLVQPKLTGIEIYRNTGTEWIPWKTVTWSVPMISEQFHPRAFLLTDINADQIPDILYNYLAPSSIVRGSYLSGRSGTDVSWTRTVGAAPPNPLATHTDEKQRSLIADWNADGFLDIFSDVSGTTNPSPSNLPVWSIVHGNKGGWNLGTDATAQLRPLRWSPVLGARVVDFNSDGLPDVLYSSINATVGRRSYLNTGLGFRYEPSWRLPAGILSNFDDPATSDRVEFTDLNGDGLTDIYYSTILLCTIFSDFVNIAGYLT